MVISYLVYQGNRVDLDCLLHLFARYLPGCLGHHLVHILLWDLEGVEFHKKINMFVFLQQDH